MDEYLIKNTTRQQRMELIRYWQPEDETYDDNTLDIWEIYRDYIDGKKEISECNAAFDPQFVTEEE